MEICSVIILLLIIISPELYYFGAHDDATFFPFLIMRYKTYLLSYYYLSINPKSSFTVISTT
jgi:hypothetical protein